MTMMMMMVMTGQTNVHVFDVDLLEHSMVKVDYQPKQLLLQVVDRHHHYLHPHQAHIYLFDGTHLCCDQACFSCHQYSTQLNQTIQSPIFIHEKDLLVAAFSSSHTEQTTRMASSASKRYTLFRNILIPLDHAILRKMTGLRLFLDTLRIQDISSLFISRE